VFIFLSLSSRDKVDGRLVFTISALSAGPVTTVGKVAPVTATSGISDGNENCGSEGLHKVFIN